MNKWKAIVPPAQVIFVYPLLGKHKIKDASNALWKKNPVQYSI